MMKKFYVELSLLLFLLLLSMTVKAQTVSPYQLSTQWAFGVGGRMSFTGDFPSSSAPSIFYSATNTGNGTANGGNVENSTAIAYRNKTVALYTNSLKMYKATNTAWNTNVFDLQSPTAPIITCSGVAPNGICSGSAVGGGLLFPDPANNLLNDAFYMVNANDVSGTSMCGTVQGSHRTRYVGASDPVYDATHGIVNVMNCNAAEAIAVATDGVGGYWLVQRDRRPDITKNDFYVWHYTSTGITGPVIYTLGSSPLAASNQQSGQSSLKFSPCQDKLAFSGAGRIYVYPFNKTTGVLGSTPLFALADNKSFGLEFSSDGNVIYYSDGGGNIYWNDMSLGTSGAWTGGSSEQSWSMQLGLDGKIYTSPGGDNRVGVITGANSGSAKSVSYINIPSPGLIYRGLSNLAWLSPQTPLLTNTATATCNIYTIDFLFRNYYNTNVSILSTGATIDYGDGSAIVNNPTFPHNHTFPTTGGPYTVTYTFKDAFCQEVRTVQTVVIVTCPSPVELIDFTGKYNHQSVDLYWSTASEFQNDYFEVQRSTDGVNFETIKTVKGSGNSKSMQYYTTNDSEKVIGKVYYRLVQHDYDGSLNYSKVINVNVENSNEFQVYPNPFNHDIVVVKSMDEKVLVVVYDVLGRIIESKEFMEGETKLSMGSTLASGSYILKVFTPSIVNSYHIEKK